MQGKSPIIFILYLYVYLHSVIKRGVGNRYLKETGKARMQLSSAAAGNVAVNVCEGLLFYKHKVNTINFIRINVSCGRIYAGVGGKSVRQADVSGGTHFPRKLCPTGQDIVSVLG